MLLRSRLLIRFIAYSWSIVTPLLGPQSAAQFRTKSEKFDKSTRGTQKFDKFEAVGSWKRVISGSIGNLLGVPWCSRFLTDLGRSQAHGFEIASCGPEVWLPRSERARASPESFKGEKDIMDATDAYFRLL
jgi:hypothetical protein